MQTDDFSTVARQCLDLNSSSTLSVRAVTLEAVLDMAGFMGDFRPAEVFWEHGAAGRRVLNPMWVSGLVGEAVRRHCTVGAVKRVWIEHIGEGFEGKGLHARFEATVTQEIQDRVSIRFEVVDEKGKVLARAAAEVVLGVDLTGG